MKKCKTLLAVLMIVTMVFGLTACGDSAKEETTKAPQESVTETGPARCICFENAAAAVWRSSISVREEWTAWII